MSKRSASIYTKNLESNFLYAGFWSGHHFHSVLICLQIVFDQRSHLIRPYLPNRICLADRLEVPYHHELRSKSGRSIILSQLLHADSGGTIHFTQANHPVRELYVPLSCHCFYASHQYIWFGQKTPVWLFQSHACFQSGCY